MKETTNCPPKKDGSGTDNSSNSASAAMVSIGKDTIASPTRFTNIVSPTMDITGTNNTETTLSQKPASITSPNQVNQHNTIAFDNCNNGYATKTCSSTSYSRQPSVKATTNSPNAILTSQSTNKTFIESQQQRLVQSQQQLTNPTARTTTTTQSRSTTPTASIVQLIPTSFAATPSVSTISIPPLPAANDRSLGTSLTSPTVTGNVHIDHIDHNDHIAVNAPTTTTIVDSTIEAQVIPPHTLPADTTIDPTAPPPIKRRKQISVRKTNSNTPRI